MLFALDCAVAPVSRFLLVPFDSWHFFIAQVTNDDLLRAAHFSLVLGTFEAAAAPFVATLAAVFAFAV